MGSCLQAHTIGVPSGGLLAGEWAKAGKIKDKGPRGEWVCSGEGALLWTAIAGKADASRGPTHAKQTCLGEPGCLCVLTSSGTVP
jgi:hypothetical protein